MFDQQRLRPACADTQAGQSRCKSIEYSMIIKLLTKHHLEFLKGGCTCSSGVYICQNVTFLDITCLSSFTETCVGEPMISGNYSLIDNQAFSASSSRDASHLPANSRWYSGSMGKYTNKWYTYKYARIQRVGGRESGHPPLKNHKNIRFFSKTGQDPLKTHEAAKPTFNCGPS